MIAFGKGGRILSINTAGSLENIISLAIEDLRDRLHL